MRRRAVAAGDIVLSGQQARPFGATGIRIFRLLLQALGLIVVALLCGILLVEWIMASPADGGAGAAAAGGTELATVMNVLDQMVNEQRQQRVHLDALQQAVGSTAQGVGFTQQVTQGVVSEVVQQVHTAMQQRYQESQDQLQQVSQAVVGLQQQIHEMAFAQAQSVPVGPSPVSPQSPGGHAAQSAVGSQAASPVGHGVGLPTFANNLQGGGLGVNPAIAYAIQQGGVDSKVLSKPSTYDPAKHQGYMAFNDWSDHIITCVDAQIPGTWEILEHIKDTQPSMLMTVDDLALHFPNLDKATLEYSNSNLYAVLITYTLNEARNIVRQARRPNGYEAWKLLQRRFNPVTIGRQRAGLTNIANPSQNIPLAQLSSEIVSWETRIAEFESRPHSEKISESIKMAALVSMCPNKLKDHLQLNAQRFGSYQDLRDEIYDVYLDHTQGLLATQMDLGSLQKGSGKSQGCYECGGPHLARECPRRQKGGGRGGGKEKGKGKSPGKDKGKGKKGGKDFQKGKGW